MDQPTTRTRVPLHRRSTVVEAFDTDDPDVIEVVGSFCDERPWAEAITWPRTSGAVRVTPGTAARRPARSS